MTEVKVAGHLYPATIAGKVSDREWGGRESKSITMVEDYATVEGLFHDGVAWSIVETSSVPVFDESGNAVLDESGEPAFRKVPAEYDNSQFSMIGDITVHQDGSCTVKMGKETDVEKLLVLLYGGDK